MTLPSSSSRKEHLFKCAECSWEGEAWECPEWQCPSCGACIPASPPLPGNQVRAAPERVAVAISGHGVPMSVTTLDRVGLGTVFKPHTVYVRWDVYNATRKALNDARDELAKRGVRFALLDVACGKRLVND